MPDPDSDDLGNADDEPQQKEVNPMFSMLSTTVAGYFVAAGVLTTTAVAGRGLVHSVRLAAQGQYGAAGLQALAALATPAVLAQTATAELIVDVIDTARELSGQTLDAAQPTLNTDKAA
jgi:hypothetical protein